MDEEEIKIVNSKVQDMLFKKANHEDVINYLDSKKLNIEILLSYLVEFIENEEYSHMLDNVLSLIEKLAKWDYYKEHIRENLIKFSENDYIYFIKFHIIKKFIIHFIGDNIDMFYNNDMVYKMIKLYSIDENSGVYQNVVDLLFMINTRYPDHIVQKQVFRNIVNYIHDHNDNSIILIREVDMIIRYLNQIDDDLIEGIFKTLSSKFYEYDKLTQLTLLDSLDLIERERIANIFINEINLFAKLGSGEFNCQNELMRKIMYTYSKFYGKKFLKDNVAKNTLAVGLQYFEDNKHENYFILSFLINIFHNRDIFTFLSNDENSIMFDFNQYIIFAIIDNYYSYEPDIKKHALELIAVVSNFTLPSLAQEQFIKRIFTSFYKYEFNNFPKDDTEAMKFFTDKLFKDFKTHDFLEYETKYLETLLSI
jgi:hypothetical protein